MLSQTNPFFNALFIKNLYEDTNYLTLKQKVSQEFAINIKPPTNSVRKPAESVKLTTKSAKEPTSSVKAPPESIELPPVLKTPVESVR